MIKSKCVKSLVKYCLQELIQIFIQISPWKSNNSYTIPTGPSIQLVSIFLQTRFN